MDPLTRLEAGINQARPVIAGAGLSSYADPTPCPDWDVRAVIQHMLGALTMFRDVANEGTADPTLFERDLIGSSALDAFDTVAKEALAAWQAKGLDGTANLPFGEFPAMFALQLPAMDMVVHAWDLATATGQHVDWDQDLIEETLEFVNSTFGADEMRGDDFQPPVPVPDDAPTIDRLVGFLGRQPATR